eukprot:m.145911 g.145911  ORF g.145911 m.145911 type:complete len:279 (+) comp30458_c0_seq1:294-1130(+)
MGCSGSKDESQQPSKVSERAAEYVPPPPVITNPIAKPNQPVADVPNDTNGIDNLLLHRSVSYLRAHGSIAVVDEPQPQQTSAVDDGIVDETIALPEPVTADEEVLDVDVEFEEFYNGGETADIDVDGDADDVPRTRTVRVNRHHEVGLGFTLEASAIVNTIRVLKIAPTGAIALTNDIHVGDEILDCDKIPQGVALSYDSLVAAIMAWENFTLLVRSPLAVAPPQRLPIMTTCLFSHSFKSHVSSPLMLAEIIDEMTTLSELNVRVLRVLARLHKQTN